MSAVQHDSVFAAVSHLPHVLSYALMLQVANAEDAPTKFRHAGAGFRDFTRIAASSPEMWRDICLANKSAILKEIDQYLNVVKHLQTLIQEGNGEQLEKLFSKASESRNNWELG
jgi:prephenate dehydrogenase